MPTFLASDLVYNLPVGERHSICVCLRYTFVQEMSTHTQSLVALVKLLFSDLLVRSWIYSEPLDPDFP